MKKVKRKKKRDECNSMKSSFQLRPSLPSKQGGMCSCSGHACVQGWQGALLCPRGWRGADSVPVGGFAIRRGATSPMCLVPGQGSSGEQLWERLIPQPCSPLLQCHPFGRVSTCEPESWERLAAFLLSPSVELLVSH